MKYNTWAPMFPGFYNTVFEYANTDDDIKYHNDSHNTEFDYSDFKWDYKDYENRVGKAFCTRLEIELNVFLPVTIEFQEIVSPREYNFANDSINAAITVNLYKLVYLINKRKDDAAAYFKEKYTSCSGFISFHSNNINDWTNIRYILQNPGHRVGSLLACLCSIELSQDDITYWADSETGYINFEPIESE